MKRIASLIVVLTAPASAWAQSAPESSHPVGYYVGYLIGIGFAIPPSTYGTPSIITG